MGTGCRFGVGNRVGIVTALYVVLPGSDAYSELLAVSGIVFRCAMSVMKVAEVRILRDSVTRAFSRHGEVLFSLVICHNPEEFLLRSNCLMDFLTCHSASRPSRLHYGVAERATVS